MEITVSPFPGHDDVAIRDAARVWLASLGKGDRRELARLLKSAPLGVVADWFKEHGWDREGYGIFQPDTASKWGWGWQIVWHDGIAPLLPFDGLEALAAGLEADDPAIIQGATTSPPPLNCVQDWPVEAADSIGYAFWKAGLADTVGEVEEYFARVCFECDQLLGEPAACRWFLNWYDETPRGEMRTALLTEVNAAVRKRKEQG